MATKRRVRLSESDGMEGGIRCPNCGSYTSFGDIIATGRCRGTETRQCDVGLALDLVISFGEFL
ncbi:MAG: hypothetical protein ABEJ28_01865 [Salinigranum sp.]